MAKHKCDCGKDAVWVYMPGFSNDANPHFCDDCVVGPENKIGCSCNWRYAKEQEGLPTDLPEGEEGKDWRWVESEEDVDGFGPITKEEGLWVELDERGRPYPCSEFWYDEDGFDDEDE
jgi:hypothetical protein